MKRTPLRLRSTKAARINAVRAILRKKLLAEDIWCRRCRNDFGTDLHERLMRSQGGDPTDENAITLICRICHMWIHANPEQARQDGWLTFRKDLGGAA